MGDSRLGTLWQKLLVYFSPGKEEVGLFAACMLFLPFPGYLVAGWGLIPPFYTSVAIYSYVMPVVGGGTAALLLLYTIVLPLAVYAFAVELRKRIKSVKALWGIVIGLAVVGLAGKIYYIAGFEGGSYLYSAITLYLELF